MSKDTLIKAAKTCAAAALGALAPMVPELVSGLPAGAASIVSALVAAVLRHVRKP